ncbi:uncharacterized protein LOC130998544 [Salvia miltiorrhiza]|uniref:uncharacterized protein LOC130998544 n=1 Tax=Salvia miltiorrhiza TaxID=226208 RepID=UPI0025AC154E|nr:uncharacterized protein LOC130998544 [Salvia miltiorrhiza]
MAKPKGGTGSGNTQPPKGKTTKPPPPKRSTSRTTSEETSTKVTEDPLLTIQPEDRGRTEVLQQEEQEIARVAAESKQPKKPEEKEPKLTPPTKKSKKAQTGKATPARSIIAPPLVQAQPQPQIPETSMQEGKPLPRIRKKKKNKRRRKRRRLKKERELRPFKRRRWKSRHHKEEGSKGSSMLRSLHCPLRPDQHRQAVRPELKANRAGDRGNLL